MVVYLGAVAALLALESPDTAHLLISLVAMSLGAGVVWGRLRFVVLPLLFFGILELTSYDYSFDASAAAAAAGAILAGTILRTAWGARVAADGVQASNSAVRRHQAPLVSRLVRRFVSREALDDKLDLLRLRLDTFPHGRYHPVESLPGRPTKRADGSASRWEAMLPVVRQTGGETAMDIGPAEGYFSIQLGLLGLTTVAIEADPVAYRTAMLAIRRAGLDNVGVLALELRADTVDVLPSPDCTVFLSVWHHLVRHQGLETATALTATVWAHTRRVMFFDTGEKEMSPSFGLPAMEPDACAWLEDYLASTCPESHVQHLGRHAAFDADGNPAQRNLFAVIRASGASEGA